MNAYCNDVLVHFNLGPYSSADDAVVRLHFKAIASAGVGTACISWYGRSRHDGAGDPLDPRMPSILDAAAAAGVKISWWVTYRVAN